MEAILAKNAVTADLKIYFHCYQCVAKSTGPLLNILCIILTTGGNYAVIYVVRFVRPHNPDDPAEVAAAVAEAEKAGLVWQSADVKPPKSLKRQRAQARRDAAGCPPKVSSRATEGCGKLP
jgi:hypothetical protein